jgi:hypothetical protein
MLTSTRINCLQEENNLLDKEDDESENGSEKHERKTAPLLSKPALNDLNIREIKPQFGLLGQIKSIQ